MGEGREVYALLTYGRIIGITRQTLINDDLDAFMAGIRWRRSRTP